MNPFAEHWDVAVIGAGPAGALVARQAALRGASVLLVDKASFPRAKVCGCCINPAALDVLRGVGLDGLAARCAASPLRALRLYSGGRSACLPLAGGVALSRSRFDAALVEAATDAGVVFADRTHARLAGAHGRGDDGARTVWLDRCDAARRVTARIVVACDGLGGRLLAAEPGFQPRIRRSSRMGAAAVISGPDTVAVEPGVVHMACGGWRGYVGMVLLEDGSRNVAAALDPAFVKSAGGPGAAASAVLRIAGAPGGAGYDDADWRGAPRLTRRLNRPAGHRLFVVGDAAGYVEPFTGEGIAWALRSAVAAAPIVTDAVARWSAAHGERWRRAHRRAVAAGQCRCRIVAALLRSRTATTTLVRLVAAAPAAARPFVAAFHGPTHPAPRGEPA